MKDNVMSILTPNQIKALCQQYGLSPSKKYGQNYLIAETPIAKILKAAELNNTDTVVEIGPGFGILTFALAKTVNKVLAYEIEKKLIPYWEEILNHKGSGQELKEYNNIEIVWGNFLTEVKNLKFKVKGPYKVVANLPYQITSRVLRVLLEENKFTRHSPQGGDGPEKIVVMVQKEVAERITARPGEMSLLAVSVQYYGAPKIEAKVTKGNFWPQPKVDSAILSIQTHKHLNTQTFLDKEFFVVVRAGFANKRKQLWRNLSVGLKIETDYSKKAVLSVSGNEKIRAQELSIEQWKELVGYLGKNI